MKTTETCQGLSDQGALERRTWQTIVLPARTRGCFLRAPCHSGDAHTTTRQERLRLYGSNSVTPPKRQMLEEVRTSGAARGLWAWEKEGEAERGAFWSR